MNKQITLTKIDGGGQARLFVGDSGGLRIAARAACWHLSRRRAACASACAPDPQLTGLRVLITVRAEHADDVHSRASRGVS